MDDAEKFNTANPIGTLVRYWPGIRTGDGTPSKTRTPAWVMGGHTAVVSVEGYAGGIGLSHVTVDRTCHEEVTRRGDYDTCDREAVGYRIDPNEGGAYPVCRHHHREPFPKPTDSQTGADHG